MPTTGSIIRRPSKAPRWVPCSGSPELEANFPDTEHDIARDGTAMHEASAIMLANRMAASNELFDRKMENGVYINEKMLDDIQSAVDYVRSLGLPEQKLIFEQTIEHPEIPYPGTPDIWHVNAATGVLHVIDFKFGYLPVEAFENWQLVAYAHLVLSQLAPGVKTVHLHIVQPRAWHPSGRNRVWTLSFDDLWQNYVTKLYAAAQKSGECVTGPWCRNCLALAHCPAARLAAVAALEISQRAILDDMDAASLAAELELMERAMQSVKLRKEAIESLALDRIEGGELIPGYAKQASYGKRRYNKDVTDETLKAFGEAVKVDFFEHKPITPAEAERRNIEEDVIKMITHIPITGAKLSKCAPHTALERMNNARS